VSMKLFKQLSRLHIIVVVLRDDDNEDGDDILDEVIDDELDDDCD
jgi:hypothetical protein